MLTTGLGPTGQPLIDKSEGRWSSWETKFRHRFQAFAELSNPPVLDYSDFLQATVRSLSTTEAQVQATGATSVQSLLAQGTTNCFQHARKVLDEARASTLAGSGTASAGADKYAANTMVTLTKVCHTCIHSQPGRLIVHNAVGCRCRWRAPCPR